MKRINWRATVELVGISAVVVSLFLLFLELRQSQVIARTEAYAALESGSVAVRDAINRNADVWSRGAAGEALDELDELVFRNLVQNLNDDAVQRYLVSMQLGNEMGAGETLDDFAIFLHQNPGAREVWLEREMNLNRNRLLLRPEDENTRSFWQQAVTEALDQLDAAYR